MHLSHTNVGFCNYLQSFMFISFRPASSASFCPASSAMWAISLMAAIYILATGGIGGINQIAPAEATAAMSITLLCLLFVRYVTTLFHIAWLLLLDYQYQDIPLDKEEGSRGRWLLRQKIWIDDWSKQECYDFMLFTQVQLYKIFDQFCLVQLSVQTNGYIRVYTAHKHYCFDPEEIFLFFMTICKTSYSNHEMYNLIFGEHPSRWSFGYPWILKYLDTRYARTNSHEKLHDFVDKIPSFYDAINYFIQKTLMHHFTDE
jgi:hypothetical protein